MTFALTTHRIVTYRFDANRFALRPVEIVCTSCQFLEIHVFVRVHLSTVNLHDARASLIEREETSPKSNDRQATYSFIRMWKFDFSI